MQSNLLIVLGVVLIVAGVLWSADQANWLGRFSRRKRTFESRGLGLRGNWLSIVFIVIGFALILIRAAAFHQS
jgi:hypothetical protein